MKLNLDTITLNHKYYKENDAVVSVVLIEYDDQEFCGYAFCHPEDAMWESELTGCYIAETRAYIELYKYIRDKKVGFALKTLTDLYGSMKQSYRFNENSFESIMMRKEIHLLQNLLATVRQEIAMLRKSLDVYIKEKDKLHKRLVEAKKE